MKEKLDRLLRAHPPIRFIADVVDVYFSKKVGRAAAELAYFLILTFFPVLICVSAFVNELHLDLTGLLNQADPFLPEGVLVIDISPDSAAQAAGLQVGDWIIAFNGQSTPTSALLNYEKDKCAVGDRAELTVLREGQRLTLTCQLGAMPGTEEN